MNAVSAMPRRILALWFPRLPADRVRRKRFGPAWRIEKAPEGPGLVFWRREGNADRLAAVACELRKLGAGAEETADGLVVHPAPLHGAAIETYNDHRMAMSFAVGGLAVPGMTIKNSRCVDKSFPNFWDEFKKLG